MTVSEAGGEARPHGASLPAIDVAGCDAVRRVPQGPRKHTFRLWGLEAPGWPGARTEHTGSIRPTNNAARRDASAAERAEVILTWALRRRASTYVPTLGPGAEVDRHDLEAMASGRSLGERGGASLERQPRVPGRDTRCEAPLDHVGDLAVRYKS